MSTTEKNRSASRASGNALLWFLFLLGGLFVFTLLVMLPFGNVRLPLPPTVDPPEKVEELAHKYFASCDALAETISMAREEGRGYFGGDGLRFDSAIPTSLPQAASESAGTGASGQDYTGTNVQVSGVDEADIVKTDGSYVYVLSNNQLHIVDVADQKSAHIVSTIQPGGQWASDMFLYGDSLAIFTTDYADINVPELRKPVPSGAPPPRVAPSSIGITEQEDAFFNPYPGGNIQLVSVELYDISNRSNPSLIRTLQFEGNLLSSRLIDNEVIVVVQSWPTYWYLGETRTIEAPVASTLVPRFRDNPEEDLEASVGCADVGYISPIVDSNYLSVARFAIDDASGDVERNVTMGAGSTVYASASTLYVAGADYSNASPTPLGFPAPGDVIAPEESREQTRIHSFSLGNTLGYVGTARVFGSILNQFSMDEYAGAFRIATTDHRWGSRRGMNGPVNALYTLDATTLEPLGAIEDIAPGETIYSARFLGERAYLVTFKKVDPFFAIDVSDPRNPHILGQLKIPGFSDYLHPFNAEGTMIIGVGKNAEESESGNFAWYQGMKIALFDATDPTNPVELHKVEIGDRGTSSPALQNHKAFLFDSTRNLLVLPISLAEIEESVKARQDERSGSTYGSYVYQGAYVYSLTADDGFELLGRVTHLDNPDEFFLKSGFYLGPNDFFVNRSLRIDDTIVTLSLGKLVLSDLNDALAQVSEVRFSSGGQEPPILFE